jgi:hypothetical protein
MGVLSDLVVASGDDAMRIAELSSPAAELGGIDIKGIDTVKLAMLHAVVSGRTYEDVLALYEPTGEGSQEGPWVVKLPADLVAALAGLDESAQRRVGTRWAQIEEFALDGWQVADVCNTLEGICGLARQATESAQSVFLWICL